MGTNPFLGVVFHWLGGLAAGSFYVPFRRVRGWAWEVYWLVGGVFSWIVAPWVVASLRSHDLLAVIREAPWECLGWSYFWGVLWGVGGLTFGLTMRYLGLSLGMAVALGYCALFGTLLPPIFHGEFVGKVLGTRSGMVILLGVGVCLAGIATAGSAGRSKEREMTDDQKRATISEFSFAKGIAVATISGILSSCMAYGLDAAQPMAEISARHGTPALWTGLPKLCVVLLGGFTTNFLWCAALTVKNKTGRQYLAATGRPMPGGMPPSALAGTRVPLLANYFFSMLAGTVWYFQFFFYSMGETQMGEYKFSSWTIHMASIILFSSLWGNALKEWKGSSPPTKLKLAAGLLLLVGATIVIGYGNRLGAPGAAS